MRYFCVALTVFFVVTGCVGMTSAAELRIITTGTGYGMVLGEQLLCPEICRKEYEEGTVVHLKADPFPDSRFVGWLIDGEPHKGVLTIEKDTVVTAMFESIAGLDDLTVYWYNGSVKEQATIATDEMVVFLEDREKWDVTTEEEFQTAIQEIIQQFHPQAEITNLEDVKNRNETIMYLKTHESLTKEQWFSARLSLKTLQYVKYAGPILYDDIESRWGWRLPLEGVAVSFPSKYTEEQIHNIEQDYGLKRRESLEIGSEVFYYYDVGDPLEAIDLANRLYESGIVEMARPDIYTPVFPTAVPNDEYFLGEGLWSRKTGQECDVRGLLQARCCYSELG